MISSENVTLRPITKEDTQLVLKWRNSPAVSDNFVHREIITEEAHLRYFDNNILTGRIAQFIIIRNEDNAPIGSVYLRDIDRKNDKAEFGIFIGEATERGKGYGKQATALICRYGFEELKLNKITLRVFPFNKSAVRAYESVGFRQEAYFRQDIKINGKYEDMIFMGMTAEEFMSVQEQ